MCQLTYSNLHEAELNRLMVYLLGKIGSEKHDDGVGFICTDNKIWKSELEANKILNLGEILSVNIIDDKPIPFHIRSATWGIEVTKENAHPFFGEHYILMHNGTLLPKNGEETKDKKHDSDSLKFLTTLDECKNINKAAKFDELFNASMNNFSGKFAFIIREKETNDDYIIRGKTAELWISYITIDGVKNKGYVINTSKDTMKSAFKEFVNIWDLFFPEYCEFTEPVLLEQETIFIAREYDIEKIGDTKETEPKKEKTSIVPRTDTRNYYGDNYGNFGRTPYYDKFDSDVAGIVEHSKKIYEFLSDHCMSLLDFQLMVMVSGGVSILELTEQDLIMFIEYIIPKISANKKVKAEVKSILNGASFPNGVYEKFNLEYPWTVNEGNKVVTALKQYLKEI